MRWSPHVARSRRRRPPSAMASRALSTRFRIAFSSWFASTDAGHSSSASTISHVDPLAERAAQQLRHAGDQPVDVERPAAPGLAAGEGEQPMGQRAARVRALPRCDIAVDSPARPAPARRRTQIQAADDDRQQVVEVVRDAAGELADGLHLLGLAQRLLGAQAPFGFLPGAARRGARHLRAGLQQRRLLRLGAAQARTRTPAAR